MKRPRRIPTTRLIYRQALRTLEAARRVKLKDPDGAVAYCIARNVTKMIQNNYRRRKK